MKSKFQQFLSNPLYVGIAAGVAGLLIGWLLIGWLIWPVSWYDAAPSHLREDLKQDYMRMAIDSYGKNQDVMLARTRYQDLGGEAAKVLEQVSAKPGLTNPADIEAFKAAVVGQSLVPTTKPGTKLPTVAATSPLAVLTPTAAPKPAGSSALWLVGLCVVLLVLGGVLAYLLIIRKKNLTPNSPTGFKQAIRPQQSVPAAPTPGMEAPIAQFMTSYKMGVDLYDDSFSIDSLNGEFLGECGVGISETIGVGDPKKVTAFEVWLFDKNDIQTVTKVMMSEYAYNDPAITQRLVSKGEPVLIRSGEQVLLETATLQLVARVVDINYGQGALPANSFFDRLTLELAIWPKPKA